MLEERSCYTGHFYLSDWPSPRLLKPTPKRNRPIHTDFKTISNLVSSAYEAKICGNFNKVTAAIGVQPDFIPLVKKQPSTSLKIDNSTTGGFVKSGMKPKPSKTWDMKFH